jgi:hypothetical protein
MARAGDSTAASIGSLSESMAKAGPTMKQLGVSIASAIAQLSLLEGLRAGAGTHHRGRGPKGVTWAMRQGRGDGWISDRTGHLTPEMRGRYARAARVLAVDASLGATIERLFSSVPKVGVEPTLP